MEEGFFLRHGWLMSIVSGSTDFTLILEAFQFLLFLCFDKKYVITVLFHDLGSLCSPLIYYFIADSTISPEKRTKKPIPGFCSLIWFSLIINQSDY